MIKRLFSCLFKPKIKPIEFNEYDLLENKIRLSKEYINVLSDSFKEKSEKIKKYKSKYNAE